MKWVSKLSLLAWFGGFGVPAGVSPAAADEPRVIKAVPEDGAVDVDPGLEEIRIEFDQDMDTGIGWSICGGGPSFPKIIGRPHEKDPILERHSQYSASDRTP